MRVWSPKRQANLSRMFSLKWEYSIFVTYIHVWFFLQAQQSLYVFGSLRFRFSLISMEYITMIFVINQGPGIYREYFLNILFFFKYSILFIHLCMIFLTNTITLACIRQFKILTNYRYISTCHNTRLIDHWFRWSKSLWYLWITRALVQYKDIILPI